ncbi:hypothetical protein ACSBR2_025236 [Camellia fascicularis]
MSEIFAKSFATGGFARSSRHGAPTSDDEREMDERFHAYTSGKGVVDESCTSGSKRKSSGQARERFYLQAEANVGAADAYSVAACMAILKSMALDPSLFLKAMNMFTSLEWRTMFMTMEPEMRYLWILNVVVMTQWRATEQYVRPVQMDLHMVCQLTRDIPTRQSQRNCPYTGDQYIKFLLSGNPKSIREQLRMEVSTFVELVKQIVRRNVVDWSNMRLSLEESLAMFLCICGQSSGTRNAGDRFQHSNETIHRHFVLMMRALGNLAPFVIQPPNMAVTHPKI